MAWDLASFGWIVPRITSYPHVWIFFVTFWFQVSISLYWSLWTCIPFLGVKVSQPLVVQSTKKFGWLLWGSNYMRNTLHDSWWLTEWRSRAFFCWDHYCINLWSKVDSCTQKLWKDIISPWGSLKWVMLTIPLFTQILQWLIGCLVWGIVSHLLISI